MEKIKYIQKTKDNRWKISLSKTGKATIITDTQKEAILKASVQKNTAIIMVKKSSGWVQVSKINNVLKQKNTKTKIIKKIAIRKTPINKNTSKAKLSKIKVSFKDITKTFGKLVANDHINFDVYENEIHALLGENGAGKSTLMSILFGLYTPTSGSIEINGQIEKIKDPRHANNLKIAMLPQHFKLVDNMSVYENVVLGYEHLHQSGPNHLKDLAKKFKIKININAKVEDLPISDKQKVEILKILWRDAEIIIFDEPTSILTAQEIKEFLTMVKYMKSIGKTILFITHKLDEIKAIADRVSVIRKGKYISTKNVKSISQDKLAKLMVGEAVDLNLSSIKRTNIKSDNLALNIKDLNYASKSYDSSLEEINLKINKGEIVGIAAIDGNGQSELIKSIAGIIKVDGNIIVDNNDISNSNIHKRYFNYEGILKMSPENKKSYDDAILKFKEALSKATKKLSEANSERKESYYKNRIKFLKNQIDHTKVLKSKPKALVSHIPEDRHKYGLVLDYSVAKNAILQDIDFYANKLGFIKNKDVKQRLDYLTKKYDIRGILSHKTKSNGLSGGNQQKLILAREIERSPKLLLASNPTRGLDVGAIRNVYEKIIEARNLGMGVLLSSGELDEIMQVSDKIIVMHKGKIVSTSKRGELSKQKLGSLMAGGA